VSRRIEATLWGVNAAARHGTFVLQPLDEVIPYTLYRQRSCPVGILAVPSRRMEDKIRKLCARAVAAGDGDFQKAISELRSALHEHAQELRKTLMEQLRGTRERRVRADSE
jgi:hypothetical protein